MNKLAYLVGYMEKKSDDAYGGLIGEYGVSPVADALFTGGLGAPIGGISALASPTQSHEEVGKYNEDPTGFVPGIGTYRLYKRMGATTKDEEGKEVPGARGSSIGEVVGSTLSPIGALGSPIGALVAMLTARRTQKEQQKHDKDSMKNVLMNLFVPGTGAYDYFKRLGSTTAY